MSRSLSAILASSLALLLLAGCGEDRGPALSQLRQAIVNGTPDTSHQAVGVLRNAAGESCTATLIGAHTVLTAGHCVASTSAPYVIQDPLTFNVGSEDGPLVQVAQVFLHPDYEGGNQSDIAVLRLSRDVPGVSPMAISSLAVQQGEEVELVGFGKTSENAGGFGVKNKAENVIGAVKDQVFVVYGAVGVTGNICNGDSGGPTFATRGGQETLIGVHSTKGGACGQEGWDMRVDAFYSWVLEAAEGDVVTLEDLDQGDPEVAIISPLPDSRVASQLKVQVQAEDDLGIARVELFVDGQLTDEQLDKPFSFELDQLRPGLQELKVVAYDPAGRRAVQAITITVDPSLAPELDQAVAGCGTFGSTCETADDCESLLCIDSLVGSICSNKCHADSECAENARCAGGVCLPGLPASGATESATNNETSDEEAAGGCNVASASGSSWAWLLLGLLALARRRRS